MKKFLAVLLSAVSVFAFAACSGDPSDEPGGGKDMTLAENYDFGDPSTWAGTSLQRLNLGDAEFDVFPEDHFYDWGQSVMYDSQEGIYKMWWCRQSRYDSIWYAESEDMKHWHSLEKVLVVEPGQDTEWIKMHVGKPSVIKVEKEGGGYEYRMYFEAPRTLKQGGRVEYDNNVFLATSDDGKDWEIWSNGGDEPYPVIAMTEADLAASEAQSAATGDSYGFYGLGQPSVTQKDGVFYLYYTHSLQEGDRMYVAKSTDGIHFTDHTEIFTRAGCGVKYNTLLEKFMLTYTYTGNAGYSRVYYMESDDGVNFPYKNLAEGEKNEIISIGSGKVRGYSDFVSDEFGQVNTHTVYAGYMEGVDPGPGLDFRLRSDTWEIHFNAFNVKEYANRTMVLPNGRINLDETRELYKNRSFTYEGKQETVPAAQADKTPDGEKNSFWDGAAQLAVDRISYMDYSVPGDIAATVSAQYTAEALYLYLNVRDGTQDASDRAVFLLGDPTAADDPARLTVLELTRTQAVAKDGNEEEIDGVSVAWKPAQDGWNAEIRIPWRNISPQAGKEIAFDCFVYDNYDSAEFKSKICWNDCLHHEAQKDIDYAGRLIFR